MTPTEIVILNGPHKGKVLQRPVDANARRPFRLPKPLPPRSTAHFRDSFDEETLEAQKEATETVDYNVVFFGAGDAAHYEIRRYAVEYSTPTDSATLFKLINELLLEAVAELH